MKGKERMCRCRGTHRGWWRMSDKEWKEQGRSGGCRGWWWRNSLGRGCGTYLRKAHW